MIISTSCSAQLAQLLGSYGPLPRAFVELQNGLRLRSMSVLRTTGVSASARAAADMSDVPDINIGFPLHDANAAKRKTETAAMALIGTRERCMQCRMSVGALRLSCRSARRRVFKMDSDVFGGSRCKRFHLVRSPARQVLWNWRPSSFFGMLDSDAICKVKFGRTSRTSRPAKLI